MAAWVDFGSAGASGRRSLTETCYHNFGRREIRQTRPTVAIAAHRLQISAVGVGHRCCDLAYVGCRLWVNMKGIFASRDENRDWVNAGNASNRPATDEAVSGTVNDNESSPGSGGGRLIDVCPCPCVSFSPSCLSSL